MATVTIGGIDQHINTVPDFFRWGTIDHKMYVGCCNITSNAAVRGYMDR